jgi:hypothetical protein
MSPQSMVRYTVNFAWIGAMLTAHLRLEGSKKLLFVLLRRSFVASGLSCCRKRSRDAETVIIVW